MEVLDYRLEPQPTLILPLYRDGNMATYTDLSGITSKLSRSHHVSAFGQLLAALDYLHRNGVVHGNASSAHFLIQRQPVFKVVLADFDLAQGNCDVTASDPSLRAYTSQQSCHWRIDTWLLSMSACEWFYKRAVLPGPDMSHDYTVCDPTCPIYYISEKGIQLATRVSQLQQLKAQPQSVLKEILSHMLTDDPAMLWSAYECLWFGVTNHLFRNDKSGLIECGEMDFDVGPDSLLNICVNY